MGLTNDQFLLLSKIGQYSEANRRTDKLAECMQQFGKHWECSHAAFVGLQLRSANLVTTYKDSNQYARWDITPVGRAKLLEERNERTKSVAQPEHPKPLYCVIDTEDGGCCSFTSLEEAEKTAKDWADESEQLVYLCTVTKAFKREVNEVKL